MVGYVASQSRLYFSNRYVAWKTWLYSTLLMFRVNPGERLGALGMEEVRRHPWFKTLSWKGETQIMTQIMTQIITKFMTEIISILNICQH